MPRSRSAVPLLAAALLSACSFANDTLWPTLSGEDPRGAQAAAATSTAAAKPAAAPGAAASETTGGTVAQLQGDLARLRRDLTQHRGELQTTRQRLDQLATGIDRLAGGIETGLQSPRTPNDPQLLSDWGRAQTQLNDASAAAARLNTISSWATSDAALASYIVQAAHAVSGDPQATAEDRRATAELQRAADRASADAAQLVTETSGEIASRSLFIAAAQRRLAALGPRISGGGERVASASPAAASPEPAAPAAGAGERRALVTIRFDRPGIAYQQQLYHAVSEALAKRPDLSFDIVAVSPPGHAPGAAAERNVESVVKSLTGMGLPADRFRLSAATLPDAAGDEVRIYPR